MSTAAAGSSAASYRYVLTPWLAGHAVLWGAAAAVAKVRGAVRVALTKAQMHELGKMSDTRLREVFDK